ncbi:hypothetical protein [Streptomyces sp. NPDC051561]|uniref:hypothetical protein n=1 Tax=Streptomyces sp. NPDC051561 TaxID=3365658 RepID=UPI0037A7623E
MSLSLLSAVLIVSQAALPTDVLADGFAGRGRRVAPLVALGGAMALRALPTWVRGLPAQPARAPSPHPAPR